MGRGIGGGGWGGVGWGETRVTHEYKTFRAIIVIYATREFNKADFTHLEY